MTSPEQALQKYGECEALRVELVAALAANPDPQRRAGMEKALGDLEAAMAALKPFLPEPKIMRSPGYYRELERQREHRLRRQELRENAVEGGF